MGEIANKCADDITNCTHTINIPHPDEKGMRIVGWVVPEEKAQLAVGCLAVEEISKTWRTARDLGYK